MKVCSLPVVGPNLNLFRTEKSASVSVERYLSGDWFNKIFFFPVQHEKKKKILLTQGKVLDVTLVSV